MKYGTIMRRIVAETVWKKCKRRQNDIENSYKFSCMKWFISNVVNKKDVNLVVGGCATARDRLNTRFSKIVRTKGW